MEDPENFLTGQPNWEVTDGASLFDVFEQDGDFLLPFTSEAGLLDEKTKNSVEGLNAFEPSESTEPDRSRKNFKYNLRQSIAWDSAFFTCEGVLEPEELSSIIEGAVDSGSKTRQMLPAIQEDISKSSESSSTLESDNVDIASLEADLFNDIRASIQRSGFTSVHSVRSENYERTESMGCNGAKNTDSHRGNIVKPKSTIKKPVTTVQGNGSSRKLDSAGAQMAKLPSSSSTQRPAATMSKTTSTVATTPQPKRMPLAAGRVKSDRNNSGTTKVAARGGKVSNDSQPRDSRKIMSKTPSSSSSKSSVTVKSPSSSTRSSCDSISSCSSSRTASSSQRKTDKVVKLPSPSSQQRTPSPIVGFLKGGKVSPAIHPRPSARVKSTKDSSSPANSVNDQSLVSPPSSSTVGGNQKGSSSVSPDSSMNNEASKDKTPTLDLSVRSMEKISSEHERGADKSQGLSVKKSGSSSNSVSVRPTGLRLPSRKIGFFDGEKKGGRTPVGSMQSPSGLSNNHSTKVRKAQTQSEQSKGDATQ